MAVFTQSRTLSVSSTAIPEIMKQPTLVPVKLSGTEGLNDLFAYQLELKIPEGLNLTSSQAANFKLNEFIGHELTVQIELEGNGSLAPRVASGSGVNIGAGTREITGLITDARLLGESVRFVHYQLTLRPWLHLATLNSDCSIYQDKTVVEILDHVLSKYSFSLDKRFIDTYPKRDYQTQFNESDYHFFCRLCEEWGINWFFEHSDGKHRLVLTDNMGAHKKNPSAAYQQIPFYPEGHKLDTEYVHRFTPAESMTSGSYSTTDYDYTRPKADLTVKRSDPRQTAHNQQEIYQWHTDAHYSQPKAGVDKDGNNPEEESEFIARMRMESMRQRGITAQGSGRLRGMVPGYTFALRKHPQTAANIDYLIIQACLTIEEVAHATQSDNAMAQRFRVDVDFQVYPLKEQYRPQRHTPKPFTHGPQTAVVVGPENQPIWTDQYGRIKVQFPWDRLGQRNQNSSCWVRVASPWAGNQLGSMQLPRTGQEVIVDFIGGDPDLPICTGRVHNQSNLPPWSLPGQSALSGFRSRELTKDGGNAASGRSNHLILDDTEQKIQVQLKSDHLHSQLSLGHITRIEDNQGRKDPRGEGFELRTDGHGVMRAEKGMLLTTEARSKAQGHITSMNETLQRLTQSRDLQETLAGFAVRHAVQDNDDQQSVAQAIKQQNDAIQGNGKAGSATAEDSAFPELGAPHLVFASPAGIQSSTAQSTHIASSIHTAITSGWHISLAAGKSFLASAGQHVRLFADMGMRLVARRGKVEIASQCDNIELIAKKVLELMADDEILLHSRKGIRLVTDGAILLSGKQGVNVFSDGKYEVYSAGYQTYGPQALPALTHNWQHGSFDQEVLLKQPDNRGAINRALEIIKDGQTRTSLHTDGQGSSNVHGTPGLSGYTVFFKGPQP